MSKKLWKPGNMLYPLPAVMVSCGTRPEDYNIITLSWTGTINSEPPMVSISVRKERYSYHIIKNAEEFVINLTTRDMARATDWCGVRSGRNYNKFKETGLTPDFSGTLNTPLISESPVNIECQVAKIIELGSHDMFLAKVVAIHVEEQYLDKKTGAFDLRQTNPIVYLHGSYYILGEKLGRFGFSVRKKRKKTKPDL
ncbi:MAG TPA: flavin reductase family protein [Bacteroidetes bacterium]|nr:flavin reductase family protein [Bacteroidota bacterium]